jgi:hypothetical protein
MKTGLDRKGLTRLASGTDRLIGVDDKWNACAVFAWEMDRNNSAGCM